MNQINRFYISSFLKNQIYFVPIMIIFFQDLGLDFTQIFWIFTIGAIFSFLIEIPTGIFADLFGKRRSIIISKFFIFLSFVCFGFSFNFITLVISNLIYELGKAFRSGTETAYTYDYILQNKKKNPSYTLVKSNQKFYARISESIGTAIGGFLAVYLGFNFVFFIAAIPAFLNFILNLFWEKIKENKNKVSINSSFLFIKKSLSEVFKNPHILKIVLNIMFFTAILTSLDKFIQPYMSQSGIRLELFGIIYSAFLLTVAFLVKYSYIFEEKYGGVRVVNFLTLFSTLPIFLLGFSNYSIYGVGLFFLVLLISNFRSPIVNTLFHDRISSHNRATMGSILELFNSLAKLMILPIIGYFADAYSMKTAIIIIGFIALIVGIVFWINVKNNNK